MKSFPSLLERQTRAFVLLLVVLFFSFCMTVTVANAADLTAAEQTQTETATNLAGGTAKELASHIAGSEAADAQCVPGDYTCDFPKINPKGVQCMRNFVCWQVTNGFTITGLCQAPKYCLVKAPAGGSSFVDSALGVIKENPLVSGIGLGVGMSLLQSLMSGSGSSGAPSGPSATSGICTTQQYYSSDPSSADPCAVYSPNGTGPTLPTTQGSAELGSEE